MNTKKIVTLGILVALTGAQCWGAADNRTLSAAMHSNLWKNNETEVEKLLSNGENPNSQLPRFEAGTLLMYAATVLYNPRMVQLLLKHGADMTLKNSAGKTVMDLAIAKRAELQKARAEGEEYTKAEKYEAARDNDIIDILTRQTDQKETVIAQEIEKSRMGGTGIDVSKIRIILGAKATPAEIRTALHIQMEFDKLAAMQERD